MTTGHAPTFDNRLRRVAKLLAANLPRDRQIGLKKVAKVLRSISGPKNDENLADQMLALLKGLHFCMWMCDKPLIQEATADRIVALLEVIPDEPSKRAFIRAFFETEVREWFGLDQYRLDKFCMMVRRFYRQCLNWLSQIGWPQESVNFMVETIGSVVFPDSTSCSTSRGFQRFFVDVIFDELKAFMTSNGVSKFAVKLLELFASVIARTKDRSLATYVGQCTFEQIMSAYWTGLEEHVTTERDEHTKSSEWWCFPVEMDQIAQMLLDKASTASSDVLASGRKRLYSYATVCQSLSTVTDMAGLNSIESAFASAVHIVQLEDWAEAAVVSDSLTNDDRQTEPEPADKTKSDAVQTKVDRLKSKKKKTSGKKQKMGLETD